MWFRATYTVIIKLIIARRLKKQRFLFNHQKKPKKFVQIVIDVALE